MKKDSDAYVIQYLPKDAPFDILAVQERARSFDTKEQALDTINNQIINSDGRAFYQHYEVWGYRARTVYGLFQLTSEKYRIEKDPSGNLFLVRYYFIDNPFNSWLYDPKLNQDGNVTVFVEGMGEMVHIQITKLDLQQMLKLFD